MQSLDSNFTNKHTFSKPKPRLYVLIMVCQHNTNWSSNTLVPKILEPNNKAMQQVTLCALDGKFCFYQANSTAKVESSYY